MEFLSKEASNDAFSDIPCLTPASPAYSKKREIFQLANQATPRAIFCPRNADEVAALVRLCKRCNIPFTIRSGGHDLQGRCIIQNAICIDMRDLNSVEVSSDRKTAKIGGGILMEKLLQDLSGKELITPFGSIPSVGYFGWASLGGYGSLSGQWGLGVDQIVSAGVKMLTAI